MVLQRLLEACGLLEGVTYLREDSHTQEGNRLRPDFVVKLP
ncbi:MAG: DNA recombination protein RmuC [Opitutales bacterium]|nr:DNA recombination protein RmuC [Opitutales bacterium]